MILLKDCYTKQELETARDIISDLETEEKQDLTFIINQLNRRIDDKEMKQNG